MGGGGCLMICEISNRSSFVVSDLNLSLVWEINFGVGVGPTASMDHWTGEGILGRWFSWGKWLMVDRCWHSSFPSKL